MGSSLSYWLDAAAKKGSVRTAGAPIYQRRLHLRVLGGVFDDNELVAIVADKTVSKGTTNRTVSEGTNKTVSGGSRRKVKTYVCDGKPQGDAEWFAGQTTSNMLDLTSASGKARLQAQLTEKEVAGTVTLADGTLHRSQHSQLATELGFMR